MPVATLGVLERTWMFGLVTIALHTELVIVCGLLSPGVDVLVVLSQRSTPALACFVDGIACSGSGTCTEDGSCSCSPGYAGDQCQLCSLGYIYTNQQCVACPTGFTGTRVGVATRLACVSCSLHVRALVCISAVSRGAIFMSPLSFGVAYC